MKKGKRYLVTVEYQDEYVFIVKKGDQEAIAYFSNGTWYSTLLTAINKASLHKFDTRKEAEEHTLKTVGYI